MNIRFKITSALLTDIRRDLARPHSFAHERVGFIAAGLAAAHDTLLILARAYRPVPNEGYLRTDAVGAMMSADTIRQARQWAMDAQAAIFHVHSHGGSGVPRFSATDARENAKFIPNFVSVAPKSVHGAIVLSDTAAFGQVWLNKDKRQPFITAFGVVGMPLQSWEAA